MLGILRRTTTETECIQQWNMVGSVLLFKESIFSPSSCFVDQT